MPPLQPQLALVFEGLLTTAPPDRTALQALVEEHLTHVRAAAAKDPFVDGAKAEQVAAVCHALLEPYEILADSERRLVAAACRYFAHADDDEDDFDSIVGFDDDAEVANHVAARLGRHDLLISMD